LDWARHCFNYKRNMAAAGDILKNSPAFNCSLNARRGRPLLSQWDQTASGQ